jgi:copper homeostasis protein CutC
MQSDVQVCHDLGAAGVVIGALCADGTIDAASTDTLLQQARTLVRH